MDNFRIVSGTVAVVATTIFAYAMWSAYNGMSKSECCASQNKE